MSTIVIIVILLGVAIIAALAVYANKLLRQLKQQNQMRQDAVQKRIDRIDESVITIAKAMQQDQCPLSEGCLRIVVLLDHRPESTEYDYSKDYPAMHDMYERIKHMPTHENRKKFPKQKIKELDKEREGYEVELKEVILADVEKLLREFPTR